MTMTDLQNLLKRVQNWPEETQNELVAVANQTESELQGDYVATHEELKAIDAALPRSMPASRRLSRRCRPHLRNFGKHEARLFAAGAG